MILIFHWLVYDNYLTKGGDGGGSLLYKWGVKVLPLRVNTRSHLSNWVFLLRERGIKFKKETEVEVESEREK